MKASTLIILILSFILLFDSIKAQGVSLNNTLDYFEKLLKPSKAFTIVLMIYMVLIIVGAILVLILIKPKIDK